jgi:polyisoprenoid-binding protein YceI
MGATRLVAGASGHLVRLAMKLLGVLRVAVVLMALTAVWSFQREAAAAPAGGLQRFVIVPGESQVSYRVNEVFINFLNRTNSPNVAVGTTRAVNGWVLIDRSKPRNSRIGPVTVDISQFQSEYALRDTVIRNLFPHSSRYPIAEFATRSIEGLPDAYVEGRDVALQIRGDPKIRDTARPATFAVTVKLDGATVTVQGTTQIRMTDFGFDPPQFVGILRAENDVLLEMRLVARARQ